MDPELVKAIKLLNETQPDAWRIFKNFLGGERDQSLLDFTNQEVHTIYVNGNPVVDPGT